MFCSIFVWRGLHKTAILNPAFFRRKLKLVSCSCHLNCCNLLQSPTVISQIAWVASNAWKDVLISKMVDEIWSNMVILRYYGFFSVPSIFSIQWYILVYQYHLVSFRDINTLIGYHLKLILPRPTYRQSVKTSRKHFYIRPAKQILYGINTIRLLAVHLLSTWFTRS